jgi:dipeptidyl aminopeptidase/acylaminoacyl peptidase
MVRRLVFGMLAVSMLLGGVVALINVRAQAPKQAQIAFTSIRDGNREIYVMDSDGENQRRLTNNNAEDLRPVWSPDGQRIAFSSERDGSKEIYIMDADGKNASRLTNNNATDGSPDWFDPAFTAPITPVSPASKLKGTWGEIKLGR